MTINIEGFGKVTASKHVLNSLSLLFDKSSAMYRYKYEETKNDDYLILSEYENDRSMQIYNELKKSGLYDR